ncbi:MAG: glycosyltransferase family 2 protein [Bacilli bacterium]|nr:glycosyltransferase family 2 protein [Bacilli bacterium]
MSIDIIVPAKNEEENIELIFKEIRKKLRNKKHNIIFVDDGSTDETFEEMKKLASKNKKIKVISFTRNFGKDAAIYAGLKYSTSEYVAIIDADLQQDPKYIVEMLEFLENNSDYDVVTMVNDYSKSKKIQRFMKKCFYKIMENNTGQNYEIGASDFRVMRRNVVKAMLEITEKNRFTKGLFSYLGFKQHSISYVPNKRQAGKSKFNLINQFRYALKGIISFSILPLSKLAAFGIIMSLLVLLMSVFIQNIKLTICLLVLLFIILFIYLWLFSLYLNKIYSEINGRLPYVIRIKINLD